MNIEKVPISKMREYITQQIKIIRIKKINKLKDTTEIYKLTHKASAWVDEELILSIYTHMGNYGNEGMHKKYVVILNKGNKIMYSEVIFSSCWDCGNNETEEAEKLKEYIQQLAR